MSEERLTVVLFVKSPELQLWYDMASELHLGPSRPQNVSKCGWTAGEIYLSYNRAYGNAFTTWWYAAVCVFQFFVGFATLYLYAWTKAELEARAREEEIKVCQKKMTFARDPASITAYPCMHRLWNKDMETVMKRYDNMHQVDVRANILCPICKDRIDFIHQ